MFTQKPAESFAVPGFHAALQGGTEQCCRALPSAGHRCSHPRPRESFGHQHLRAVSSSVKLSLPKSENLIPSGEFCPPALITAICTSFGLCWRLLKSGTHVLGIIFSTAFFLSLLTILLFFAFFVCLFVFFFLSLFGDLGAEGFAESLHYRGGILQGQGDSALLYCLDISS